MPGNFLAKLLGQPQVNSSDQLRQAQTETPTYDPDIEAKARSMGFKSAHEMLLFERARQGGTVQRSRADQVAQAAERGDATTWHPRNLLRAVADAMSGAR